MEKHIVCYYYILYMSNKTNKLKCIVTGRQLIATKNYYARKVELAGDEDELHRTYICREAKNLLKQGCSVNRVREILEVVDMNDEVDQQIIDSLLTEEKKTKIRKINNLVSTSKTLNNRTDPKVKKFIKNILNE